MVLCPAFPAGTFEAGFFPVVLLYLSFWLLTHRRGRATSLILVGIPLSGLVGGLISGSVMDGMNGWLGLHGWRWLLAVGCWLLAVGCWLLAVGCRQGTGDSARSGRAFRVDRQIGERNLPDPR
jgi:MFS family permease